MPHAVRFAHAVRSAVTALGLASLCLASLPAAAQQGTVKIVVAYAAGGGVDAVARVVAQQLQGPLGKSVVVENRPGGGGAIAAQAVMAAPADGNTLLLADHALLTAPHINRSARYAVEQNFAAVGMVGTVPLVLAASASFKPQTPAEVLAYLKKNPGTVPYGTPGVGTLHHLSGEAIKTSAGVEMTHVPYRGASLVIKDLAGGEVPLAIVSLPSIAPQLRSERVRLVAVLTPQRLKNYPEVPALAETLPGFDAVPALFVVAPAGTPAATIDTLNRALNAALADKATQAAFDAQGTVPEPGTPRQLSAWMRAEEARWAEVADKGKISQD